MDFLISKERIEHIECDVLVVGVYEAPDTLAGPVCDLEDDILAKLDAAARREDFTGKHSQILETMLPDDIRAYKLLVIGLGSKDSFNANELRKVSAAVIKRAAELSAKTVAMYLNFEASDIPTDSAAEAIASAALLASYQFTAHKTDEKKPITIERIELIAPSDVSAGLMQEGCNRGQVIAESICYARDLINTPANFLTPSYLASQAVAIAEKYSLQCNTLDPDKMRRLGMNLLLAVASGSSEEPKFISLRYSAPSAKKTVAIVGKGLTFDAGGLCIKPSRYMDTMKNDMSGAAAVIATMQAISQLKPDVNVLCLVPATENMPGNRAVKPGDIETALSGKTVEINDTDAEGRLILADAVAYAENEKVDEIIDIATLTGSCEGALGKQIAGVLSTDQSMADKLIESAARGGEKLWQLPLEADYNETLDSDVADMKNYAPEAGTITAALFIKKHIQRTPWAHLDIAGTAYNTNGKFIGAKGGTGFGVYTLVNYLLGR